MPPGVDLAGIGSLVSVLTGLFVTVGTLLLQRQRRQAVDADDVEHELEVRTRQFNVAMRFLRQHEEERSAFTDLAALPRPRELRAGWFQREISQGKRRRTRDTEDEDDEPAEDVEPEPVRPPRRARRPDRGPGHGADGWDDEPAWPDDYGPVRRPRGPAGQPGDGAGGPGARRRPPAGGSRRTAP